MMEGLEPVLPTDLKLSPSATSPSAAALGTVLNGRPAAARNRVVSRRRRRKRGPEITLHALGVGGVGERVGGGNSSSTAQRRRSWARHARMTGRCPSGRPGISRSSMDIKADHTLDQVGHGDRGQTIVREFSASWRETS